VTEETHEVMSRVTKYWGPEFRHVISGIQKKGQRLRRSDRSNTKEEVDDDEVEEEDEEEEEEGEEDEEIENDEEEGE